MFMAVLYFCCGYIFAACRIIIPEMEVHREENGNSILNKKNCLWLMNILQMVPNIIKSQKKEALQISNQSIDNKLPHVWIVLTYFPFQNHYQNS